MLALVVLVGAGCGTITPRYRGDTRMHSETNISVNFEQMRLHMRSQVHPMCGVVVDAADQILAGTTNREVRRQALLWKIEAVPALREALYQPNPLTAVFDTWVMTFQMQEYFTEGPGRTGLGSAHQIAVAASERLEADLAQIARSMTVSGDITEARAFAKTWAAAHPMRPSISSRRSTASRATEKEVAASFSTTEAVGNLTVTVDDINRRLEVYSAQLPDQARWQAELLALEFTGEFSLDRALPLAERTAQSASRAVETVDRLAPAVERSLAVLETTPALVKAERIAAIEAMQQELTRTITFVQEERVAALKQLTAERMAAVQDLRLALAADFAELGRGIERSGVQVADHTLKRLAQLVALVLVAVLVGSVLLMLVARRLFAPRTSPDRGTG